MTRFVEITIKSYRFHRQSYLLSPAEFRVSDTRVFDLIKEALGKILGIRYTSFVKLPLSTAISDSSKPEGLYFETTVCCTDILACVFLSYNMRNSCSNLNVNF